MIMNDHGFFATYGCRACLNERELTHKGDCFPSSAASGLYALKIKPGIRINVDHIAPNWYHALYALKSRAACKKRYA